MDRVQDSRTEGEELSGGVSASWHKRACTNAGEVGAGTVDDKYKVVSGREIRRGTVSSGGGVIEDSSRRCRDEALSTRHQYRISQHFIAFQER